MARVLVVDDEPTIRHLLRCVLENTGHEVEEAQNGLEGIRLFRRQPADLVVTDIFMPEQEGLETIRELKRDFPNVKIIVVTGGDVVMEPENLLKIAKALGAVRVMEKPLDLERFLGVVEEVLSE